MTHEKSSFTFAISLSVLNHLGRNLYRSFATVLGEAISNSWDANANNVLIYLDREFNTLTIKDDGDGMDREDFQNKFLKIGYSKRKEGNNSSQGRPFIGRKGIGKLALLSCAQKITVLSKKEGEKYVGGVINNSGLDIAIKSDLEPSDYELDPVDMDANKTYTKDHKKGTIIIFDDLNEGIRNREEYLRKMIALYFRFSLIDDKFNIYLNGKKVTIDDLDDLAKKTQFLWNFSNLDDPYIKNKLTNLKKLEKNIPIDGNIKGFIASVEKPRYLKIITTDEKVGIDLFVNGRIREKDILKHIPTDRLAADYLYGQIHVNTLDDEKDRFTSSREGIVAGDEKFKEFLGLIKAKLPSILDDWDKWRIDIGKEGDQENPRLTQKERSSRGLFNAVSDEYNYTHKSEETEPKTEQKIEKNEGDKCRLKINQWVVDLADDAQYNFTSYAECFISENLLRRHIQENNLQLSPEAVGEAERWKETEKDNKEKGNISIDIRFSQNDSNYLSMDHLANFIDKGDRLKEARLCRDAMEYKPIRDALMHTSLLTGEAKSKLTTIYENIKGRVKNLLMGK